LFESGRQGRLPGLGVERRFQLPKTRSRTKGCALFLFDACMLGGAIYGALTFDDVLLRFLCALAAGLFVAVLYLVGHDATHGSLTDDRRLNRVLGILALLPFYHLRNMWAMTHHREHHRYTNLAGDGFDYVWVPYSKEDYDALSPFGRWRERLYRSLPGVAAHYFLVVLWKKQLFPAARYRTGANARAYAQDLMGLVPYALLSIAGPVYLSVSGAIAQPWWSALLFAVVIPQITAHWIAGLTVLLQHTHPGIRWYRDFDEWRRESRAPENTARIVFSRAFGFTNHGALDEHAAHHVAPAVPIYSLRPVQRALDEEHDLQVYAFSFSNVLKILRHCKLYDYENHRWLDFAGEPSEPVELGPARALRDGGGVTFGAR